MMRSYLVAAALCLSVVHSEAREDLVVPYGSLRPELVGRFPAEGANTRLMDDGYSRLGVHGKADLGNGRTGFYRYERRVSANDGESDGAVRGDNNELRQVYVGLRNAFGSLSIGRHYGLYYDYIDDELDRHRSHYSDATIFGDLFVSNALFYRSPNLPYGNFGILVQFNGADEGGKAVNERLELAGTLQRGALALHGGYVNSPAHDGLFGLATSYRHRALNLAAVYQRREDNDATESLYSIAADVDITSKNQLRVALTMTNGDGDRTYITAGGDHRFSDHLLFFAEVFSRNSNSVKTGDEAALISGFRFDL